MYRPWSVNIPANTGLQHIRHDEADDQRGPSSALTSLFRKRVTAQRNLRLSHGLRPVELLQREQDLTLLPPVEPGFLTICNTLRTQRARMPGERSGFSGSPGGD